MPIAGPLPVFAPAEPGCRTLYLLRPDTGWLLRWDGTDWVDAADLDPDSELTAAWAAGRSGGVVVAAHADGLLAAWNDGLTGLVRVIWVAFDGTTTVVDHQAGANASFAFSNPINYRGRLRWVGRGPGGGRLTTFSAGRPGDLVVGEGPVLGDWPVRAFTSADLHSTLSHGPRLAAHADRLVAFGGPTGQRMAPLTLVCDLPRAAGLRVEDEPAVVRTGEWDGEVPGVAWRPAQQTLAAASVAGQLLRLGVDGVIRRENPETGVWEAWYDYSRGNANLAWGTYTQAVALPNGDLALSLAAAEDFNDWVLGARVEVTNDPNWTGEIGTVVEDLGEQTIGMTTVRRLRVVKPDGAPFFATEADGTVVPLAAGAEFTVHLGLWGPALGTAAHPCSAVMFEHDGDLWVAMLTGRDDTGSGAWPLSQISRLTLDRSGDVPSVTNDETEFLWAQSRVINTSGVTHVLDDENGRLHLLYEDIESGRVEHMSVHLATLGTTFYGPLYNTGRGPSDGRSWLAHGMLAAVDPIQPNLLVTARYDSDAEVGEVTITGFAVAPTATTLTVEYMTDQRGFEAGVAYPGWAVATPKPSDPRHAPSLTASPAGGTAVFIHDMAADGLAGADGSVQYRVRATYAGSAPGPSVCDDIDVDLYVQGIVHGIGIRADAITIDGTPVADVSGSELPGCTDWPIQYRATSGADLVATGRLSELSDSVLSLCRNAPTVAGACDLTPFLAGDVATMWLVPAGNPDTHVLCSATAQVGERVTFGGCSLAGMSSSFTQAVGFSDCVPAPCLPNRDPGEDVVDSDYTNVVLCLDQTAGCFRLNITMLSPIHTTGGNVTVSFLDINDVVVQTATITATWPNGPGNCASPSAAATTYGTIISAVTHCTLGVADGVDIIVEFSTLTPFVRVQTNDGVLDGTYPIITVRNSICASLLEITSHGNGACYVVDSSTITVEGTLSGSGTWEGEPPHSGVLTSPTWSVEVPLEPGSNTLVFSATGGNTETIYVEYVDYTIDDPAVLEDAGVVTFTIDRLDAGAVPVGMLLTTADGTATAPDDYIELSEWRTLLPGPSSTSVDVTVIDRPDVQGARYFQLNETLSAECGILFELTGRDQDGGEATEAASVIFDGIYTGGPMTVDDGLVLDVIFGEGPGATWSLSRGLAPGDNVFLFDAPEGISFSYTVVRVVWSVSNIIVIEDEGVAIFTVTRTDGGSPIRFGWTTVDGTALAGVDYQTASGTDILLNGSGTYDLIVPIINRPGSQGDRVFSVNVTLEGMD